MAEEFDAYRRRQAMAWLRRVRGLRRRADALWAAALWAAALWALRSLLLFLVTVAVFATW